MTASTLLSLNFNDQSIVDNTGQWTVVDNSPQIAFERVGGSASYALVSRFTSGSNPVILNANDQSETVPYYTIEFDFYIPHGTPKNTQCSPILFRDAAKGRRICLNASHDDGNYKMFLESRDNNYYGGHIVDSDYVIIPGEWTHVGLSVFEEQDHSTAISLYINGALVDSTHRDISDVNETTICKRAQLISQLGYYYYDNLGPNGFAIDNVIVVRGKASFRPEAVSLAGLQNNNAKLLSFIKGKVSTVNNGTLTIQKNGTNVATFTANQSTNATANITVPTAMSELTNDSGYLTSSSSLDASKLTSGTVDIARLPQGALERLVKVADETARYALTTAEAQLGDTVQQLDTGIMYVVTDTDHLDSAAGYTEYTAGTAASVPWSGVTGKPTFAAVATSGSYNDLSNKPTIPTVNNATLTIQKNGTTVDTFSANSSSDKTVNITVPTKTSDLTNDSFIPLSGTNELSGNIIPGADFAYDLGSSSKNYKSLYTYSVYNGENAGALVLSGGNGVSNGAYLVLRGAGRTDGLQGGFDLVTKGSTDYTLSGFPNGNLTWGSKNVAMQEDVVPRSGGAVMRGNLFRTADDGSFVIGGGKAYTTGASIYMRGALDTSEPGWMYLVPRSGTLAYKNMILKPDGTWTWNGTACQVTSDQRFKQQISEIDDKLLDAWQDVELVQFKYNDAVSEKGTKARLHTGYVVQQIDEACQKHDVDISEYGLFCHEEYAEETREVEHEDGTKTIEVVRPASEHYSLRYTEALIVECAYLRKKLKELTARIEELEKGKEVTK